MLTDDFTPAVSPTREQLRFAVVELINYIEPQTDGELRGGLQETPDRFLKALDTWFGGYHLDPASVLKTFEDGAQGCDQIIFQGNIPVWSHCEHHMAPFFGVAHIGYIPDKRILGLSKFSRLVEIFARRLQVQERLTNQVADALYEHLQPKAVGVVLECRHTCMESRGVKQAGTTTTTAALRGLFMDEPETRSEFLEYVRCQKR